MVTILIMRFPHGACEPRAIALNVVPLLLNSYLDGPSGTGTIFLQDKSETEHDRRPNGKDHECIDVGQTRGLRLQAPVDAGVSPRLRVMRAQSRVSKKLGKAVRRILKSGIVGPRVLHQSSLVELRASGN